MDQSSPTQEEVRASPALQTLHAGLIELAALVTGAGGLPDMLDEVATYAARTIPGADAAVVTLLSVDHPHVRVESSAASDPFIARIDQIQYRSVHEGPCITTALEGRTACSGDLESEPRWPRFGPRAGRAGIQSVMALPLVTADQIIGTISVYARATDVFDDHAQELAELFTAPAAVALNNAHTLTQAIALTTRLQTPLTAPLITDEAVGLMRARTGLTSEQARERLRAVSHGEYLKLIDVAQHLVDDAVGHARACDTRS
ncbi:GAF and ANTAR domain-containing protein [Dermatophilaceae bacterium Sec6.4]